MAPPSPGRDSGFAEAFIALGGNLGEVLKTFRAALAELDRGPVEVLAVSSAYRTCALVLAGTSVPVADYWNAAARVRTTLAPEALLSLMLAIERRAGRRRVEAARWQPRTLDLDLLLFDDILCSAPHLSLPHPHLAERLFVLLPLVEVAAATLVPGADASVADLLARLGPDRASIRERRDDWYTSG